MTQRKSRRTMTAEEREERELRIDETLRLVEERRAFHQSKIAEERELREREERRRAELAELGFFARLKRRLAA